MTTLDWIFAGVLLLSLLLGAWRGLVYEVLSVMAWAASFFIAQWFAPQASSLIGLESLSEPVRYALAFVLVFVAVVFVGGLIAALVKRMVEAVGLRPIDRMLGAVFGVVRGLILLLAATVVMDMTSLKSVAWWRDSVGAPVLTSALDRLKPLFPAAFAQYLH